LIFKGPIIAGFANQFGIRPVIMVGSTIGATMWMASAFAPNIYVVMVLFGLFGGYNM
jgi:hypothetical protein